jgi:hypothetical protein
MTFVVYVPGDVEEGEELIRFRLFFRSSWGACAFSRHLQSKIEDAIIIIALS